MADKENNIKQMIKLIISNIDEFDSKFITYKADSMKRLLEDTLEYIKKEEQVLNEIEYYINNQGLNNKWNMRIQRFRMDILDIISKAKEDK